MKALIVGFLALVATVAARPAAAHSEPELAAPRANAAFRAAPRPLVRFLINSLQLPDQQALQVEQALKHQPTPITTPEALTAALRPVLTPEQLAQLQTLHPEDELQEELRYLATLH
jgi:hypothetical protein